MYVFSFFVLEFDLISNMYLMAVIIDQMSFSCKDEDRDRYEYHFQERKDEGIQVKTCSSFSVFTNDKIGVVCWETIVFGL